MKTIKTQSNDLIIVEISENEDLMFDNLKGRILSYLNDACNIKCLGKLSELEDKDLIKFCAYSIKGLTNENTWRDYTFDEWEECFYVKDSFISLLQSNGIDTSKELLILEIL